MVTLPREYDMEHVGGMLFFLIMVGSSWVPLADMPSCTLPELLVRARRPSKHHCPCCPRFLNGVKWASETREADGRLLPTDSDCSHLSKRQVEEFPKWGKRYWSISPANKVALPLCIVKILPCHPTHWPIWKYFLYEYWWAYSYHSAHQLIRLCFLYKY